MRFYIIFCTNVMSGLPLLCADLRFGLSPASLLALFGLPRISPLLQSPFRHSFSLLLDFLLSPLHFKVQSSALSHSFWTSACLPSTSKSIPQLFLTPPRKKGGLQSNPPVSINQSNPPSANSTK